MIPAILAAAEPATAAGGENMLVQFGIEPVLLAMQLISFAILAGVLYKFMIKPVLATADERAQKISSGLQYADEMQAKLAAAQQESAAILKQASVEASRFVDEARKSAKDYLEKQTHETAAKINDMLVKSREAVELEHKKMLADARVEIARLVVVTTERVLSKRLSYADRAAYNDAASRELTNV